MVNKTSLLQTDRHHSSLKNTGAALAYTPHGYHGHSSPVSLLAFNGEPHEPLTGHYLLGQGYRAYAPVLMRFTAPDSVSPFGKGGINAYAYAQGDPVNYVDPDGHIRIVSMLTRIDLPDVSMIAHRFQALAKGRTKGFYHRVARQAVKAEQEAAAVIDSLTRAPVKEIKTLRELASVQVRRLDLEAFASNRRLAGVPTAMQGRLRIQEKGSGVALLEQASNGKSIHLTQEQGKAGLALVMLKVRGDEAEILRWAQSLAQISG